LITLNLIIDIFHHVDFLGEYIWGFGNHITRYFVGRGPKLLMMFICSRWPRSIFHILWCSRGHLFQQCYIGRWSL